MLVLISENQIFVKVTFQYCWIKI